MTAYDNPAGDPNLRDVHSAQNLAANTQTQNPAAAQAAQEFAIAKLDNLIKTHNLPHEALSSLPPPGTPEHDHMMNSIHYTA